MEENIIMPCWRRLIGTFIDKTLVLVTFYLISLAISPFGAPNYLGIYAALFSTNPNNYDYMLEPCWEIDVFVTVFFVVWNLLYYILCEYKLGISLGNRIMGGQILDIEDNPISLGMIIQRALCALALMAGVYLLFHVMMKLPNVLVVISFFAILDSLTLFKGYNLIDKMTETQYTMRNKKTN